MSKVYINGIKATRADIAALVGRWRAGMERVTYHITTRGNIAFVTGD